MKRMVYDFFGKEIDLDKEKYCPVYYVQCDCGHLAIRKNNTDRQIFRCSLCKNEYQQRQKTRKVVPIFKEL
ncbi:transcriptional regulator [Enterococcus faecalis]|nr:transcriptional regulator [Enterococcus faecalis]